MIVDDTIKLDLSECFNLNLMHLLRLLGCDARALDWVLIDGMSLVQLLRHHDLERVLA